jgi:hypothetical protein
MKTKRSRAKARLLGVGALIFSIAALIVPIRETGLAAQSNTIHVNRNGARFGSAPDGSSDKPYHLVEAGVCKAQSAVTRGLAVGARWNIKTKTRRLH